MANSLEIGPGFEGDPYDLYFAFYRQNFALDATSPVRWAGPFGITTASVVALESALSRSALVLEGSFTFRPAVSPNPDSLAGRITAFELRDASENLILRVVLDGSSFTVAQLTGTGAQATLEALFAGIGGNWIGAGGEDSLYGAAGNDRLDGRGGSDTLDGGAGADTLQGGDGADRLAGGAGGDSLSGGGGNDSITGGAGNDRLDGGTGIDSLVGGAGDDTYRVTDASDTITEAATGGTDTVETTVALTLGANLERLVVLPATGLAGTGNALANALVGAAGDDTLAGAAGSDTVEGNGGADVLRGDAGDDVLRGGDGADLLDGGGDDDSLVGGAGTDTLDGGAGDDTYLIAIGDELDTVTETLAGSAGGTDTVLAAVDFTLGANVEKLVLAAGITGLQGTGNASDNVITGNDGGNVLSGLAGDDHLEGRGGSDSLSGGGDDDWLDGGSGADAMEGGAGDDTYVVDRTDDTVVEAGAQGSDTVRLALSNASPAVRLVTLQGPGSGTDIGFSFVESVVLLGAGRFDVLGTDAANALSGNASANTLTGLDGDDTLAGGAGNDTLAGGDDDDWLDGGSGADGMDGGIGDDTFTVDSALDTIVDGGGTDTLRTLFNVATPLRADLENLELLGSATIGTGNAADNRITGNALANRLDGGAGNDTMDGRGGADVYLVDAAGDVVEESIAGAPGGVDTVITSAAGTTTLGTNIEVLVLAAGSAATGGTGNALANRITGNAAGNLLTGGGGVDTLAGGVGDDTYGVDDLRDLVLEAANQGRDVVLATSSYVLPNAVEDAVLDAADGSFLRGNALANDLSATGATDNLLDGGAGADSLAGGDGDDTYVADSALDVVTELPGEGTDTLRVSYTAAAPVTPIDLGGGPYANIENLELLGAGRFDVTGTAVANRIAGNASANAVDGAGGADTLSGGAGNDTLSGGTGSDILDGGTGTDSLTGGDDGDTYRVDSLAEVIVETGVGGIDAVESTVSYSIAALANVEALVLLGAALTGTGNGAGNAITGNALGNTLDGGTGDDTLTGGTGNDLYLVDSSADAVVELAGGGLDTVRSTAAAFALDDHVENLVLLATGDADGTGNALANVITGNAFANRLDGGAGRDVLAGGAGNDTYVVDDVRDAIVEAATGGVDRVDSSVSWVLGTGLETLQLTGASAIDGTGNALANAITGNGAANLLDGAGGADALTGGDGDDTYVVDQRADTVTEGGTADRDLVRIRYAAGTDPTIDLGADYGGVEDVELLGAGAFQVTGTASDNRITGNALANALDGAGGDDRLDGGAGVDTLTGGDGDDTFVFDVAGDSVVEGSGAGSGTDLLESRVSVDLLLRADLVNVENVTLLGTAALEARGGAGANELTGNAGNNLLDGRGGDDVLRGGAGNDRYVVAEAGDQVIEAPTATGYDTVVSRLASYTLTDRVEALELDGPAVTGIGNALANRITGNALANDLDGQAGADVLAGGAGDDTYRVDDVRDVLIEPASAGGRDRVVSTVSWTLGAAFEDLRLTGSADASAIGNAVANDIEGNDGDNLIDGRGGADTLAGGAGDDTFVVDSLLDVVSDSAGVDTLRVLHAAGTAVRVIDVGADPAYADLENVEVLGAGRFDLIGDALANRLTGNAFSGVLDGGDANDTLSGGGGNDTLSGGEGNDSLDGGTGADSMTGGLGDDTYRVDSAADVITTDNGGTDTVISTVSFSLALHPELEHLTLSGTAALGTGNALQNHIVGNAAANRLDGGAERDTLEGGLGNDTYGVDQGDDVVVEASGVGSGIDTVRSTAGAYTLSANVERLELVGAGPADGTGNALANLVTGNAFANRLDGAAGRDTLEGGAGNDTYVVDDLLDLILEPASNGGTDTVESSVTWVLGTAFENLVLTGSADASGFGNALANAITGNDGDNLLDGRGGADVLSGGLGDDTFVVDNSGDSVADSGGNDSVRLLLAAAGGAQSIDLASTYAGIENLELLGAGAWTVTGTAEANLLVGALGNDSLDGGDGDDRLSGGGGNDSLSGGLGNDLLNGGAGSDLLDGGDGNDTYLLDAVGDFIIDDSSGVDEVRASFAVTLMDTLENLTLLGSTGITGRGNDLANVITGNAGANDLRGFDGDDALSGGVGADTLAGGAGDDTLSGGVGADTLAGGAGEDTLTGGDGVDRFVFDTAAGAGNVDELTDFTAGEDLLVFSRDHFGALPAPGALPAIQFAANALGVAQDGADRVVYNTSSGELWYDADGSGGGAAVLVAVLADSPLLTAASVLVIA